MLEPVEAGISATVVRGDCLQVMRRMAAHSVDSIVCDPPAGINFMNKPFDSDRGGRTQWIAWLSEIMAEALRVMKPGAHGLVWALPRTSHWTATALEDAGFEVRDVITHHFGTGFPKSKNLGDGFGTTLKPASEHWILVRKPCVGSATACYTEYGTGGLNIDECRVKTDWATDPTRRGWQGGRRPKSGPFNSGDTAKDPIPRGGIEGKPGRFPANLILSHDEECKWLGSKKIKKLGGNGDASAIHRKTQSSTWTPVGNERERSTHYDPDGREAIDAYECVEGCPVAELDRQSGPSKSTGGGGYRNKGADTRNGIYGAYGERSRARNVGKGDSGGASRFFYVAKASRRERGEGNAHPTVKPVALMRYLVRMVTPPDGKVLDPFLGSGTTGVAATLEGFEFIGIEKEPEYAITAKARIACAQAERGDRLPL